jgi:hypothetical protein
MFSHAAQSWHAEIATVLYNWTPLTNSGTLKYDIEDIIDKDREPK